VELMSIKDAAAEMGITPERMRGLCKTYKVGTRIGRMWVLTRQEVDWLKSLDRSPGRPKKGGR
jgi:hypothetical protein